MRSLALGELAGHPFVRVGPPDDGTPLVVVTGLNDPLLRVTDALWFAGLVGAFGRRLRRKGYPGPVYVTSRPVGLPRDHSTRDMADDLAGKGNLFVVFGEPDIEVVSGRWLVASSGRMVVNHDRLAKLSGLGGLEEINRLGGRDLPRLKRLAAGRTLRADEIAAIEALTPADFPLSLTTSHWTQVTLRGVDVFHPQTGEIESSGPDGIACWFIDTDYNEESFFVRHAYFLGASDPYKALKTTLKAEIDEDAWSSLNSDTSRPFDKPTTGRIAVKVINQLGDEVMKGICRLQLGRVGKRVEENYRCKFDYAPDLVDHIVARCKETETGARNIEHILNRTLLPELAAHFLERMASEQGFNRVHVSIDGSGAFQYLIE